MRSRRYKYQITVSDAPNTSTVFEGWYQDACDAVTGAMRMYQRGRAVGTSTTITCIRTAETPVRRVTPGLKLVSGFIP